MKNKLTNVKKYIEFVVYWTEETLKRDKDISKYIGATILAPIDKDALREIKLLGEAILRKHAAKNTRKDIYIEQK